MTVESEADRIAWLTADGETITAGGTDAPALVAETSGETLGASPTDVDGTLEVLMTQAQIVALSIVEGGAITVRGAAYTVGLIEYEEASASAGLAVIKVF